MYKEKCIDEYIEKLLQDIENKSMTEKEKLMYLRKIITGWNRKIRYYKDMGIDLSIGMFLVGTGIGNEIGSSENTYLSIALCTIGMGSIAFSTIKRNIKYNINEPKREKTKTKI